jgi:hypothetical protein
VTTEQRIAELEREWARMRLYFIPLDRFVAYQMNCHGLSINVVLESLVVYEDC